MVEDFLVSLRPSLVAVSVESCATSVPGNLALIEQATHLANKNRLAHTRRKIKQQHMAYEKLELVLRHQLAVLSRTQK